MFDLFQSVNDNKLCQGSVQKDYGGEQHKPQKKSKVKYPTMWWRCSCIWRVAIGWVVVVGPSLWFRVIGPTPAPGSVNLLSQLLLSLAVRIGDRLVLLRKEKSYVKLCNTAITLLEFSPFSPQFFIMFSFYRHCTLWLKTWFHRLLHMQIL